MKRLGFTLAEILVSLAIVGVVAAICVPTLGTNARKQANLATLKVTISDLETAFGTMIVAYGAEELKSDWIQNGKYTNFIKMDGNKTKNGSVINGLTIGKFSIDVNGDGKPNKKLHDQFDCELDSYGLISCDTGEE